MRPKRVIGGIGLLSLVPMVSATNIFANPEAGIVVRCASIPGGWFPAFCVLLLGGVAIVARARDRTVGTALIPAAVMAGMIVWGLAIGAFPGIAAGGVSIVGIGVVGYILMTLPGRRPDPAPGTGGSGI